MFVVPPAPPAYEIVLPATPTPTAGIVLASTSAHLKTLKLCPAHQHFVKGVCTPYIEWGTMPPPPPPMKTAKS